MASPPFRNLHTSLSVPAPKYSPNSDDIAKKKTKMKTNVQGYRKMETALQKRNHM